MLWAPSCAAGEAPSTGQGGAAAGRHGGAVLKFAYLSFAAQKLPEYAARPLRYELASASTTTNAIRLQSWDCPICPSQP